LIQNVILTIATADEISFVIQSEVISRATADQGQLSNSHSLIVCAAVSMKTKERSFSTITDTTLLRFERLF
jgi:hypothetical protein